MKKILFSVILLAIFSCNSKSKPGKTTYAVTDWQATVPQNIRTWDAASGWVKMVVYSDSVQYKDDTAGDGTITRKKTVVSDTFYLLRTADKNLPLKDSAGIQKIDPGTKQPLYYLSWNNAAIVSKDVIHPEIPIPIKFLPQLYNSIPQVIKDSSKGNFKVIDNVKGVHDTTIKEPTVNRKVVK
jgi:hypothetical protein